MLNIETIADNVSTLGIIKALSSKKKVTAKTLLQICKEICDMYHDNKPVALVIFGHENLIFAHKHIINSNLSFYQLLIPY